jgi:hypothetical protein
MATTIISVSLPLEYARYLDDKKEKPSKLLQESIKKLMDEQKVSPELVKSLQGQIDFLRDTINTQRVFIADKGLMKEFYEFERVHEN